MVLLTLGIELRDLLSIKRGSMKHRSPLVFFLFITVAFFFIAGCSPEEEVEAVEGTEDLIFTYDGKTCEFDGPKVILEGEITLILDNLTDFPVFVDPAKLDDDKTWQDMLNYIGEPGSYKQRPGWITKEPRKPVISDPRAAIFSPDPGEFVLVLYQTTDTGLAAFPCSSFEVR
jgi:hypothetical protein